MNNIWTRFQNLLPKKQQYIGKIISVNSSQKTCVVTILGGANITIKGEGNIGSWHVIEDGVLGRIVPELPVYNITIY